MLWMNEKMHYADACILDLLYASSRNAIDNAINKLWREKNTEGKMEMLGFIMLNRVSADFSTG